MNIDRKMLYFIYKPSQHFIWKKNFQIEAMAYEPILQVALKYKPRCFLPGTNGSHIEHIYCTWTVREGRWQIAWDCG